ncbi:hypothetical protein AMBR_DPAELIID_02785 [Lacticaseibacillus rhamnosus]|nr:hypothetical protein AMBR_DPAELIID_02785 [Lacticaseibacillus rhamnosus]
MSKTTRCTYLLLGAVLHVWICLLYTSDAADDTPCVDLGGRRLIKKKKKKENYRYLYHKQHNIYIFQ